MKKLINKIQIILIISIIGSMLSCSGGCSNKNTGSDIVDDSNDDIDSGMAEEFCGALKRSAGTRVKRDSSSEETSSVLIDRALENKVIDSKKWALYQLLAQFSPDLLPEEYKSSLKDHDFSMSAMLIAKAHLDNGEYSAAETAVVNSMLADPSDPEFMALPDCGNAGRRDGIPENSQGLKDYNQALFGKPIPTSRFLFIPMISQTENPSKLVTLREKIITELNTLTPNVGNVGNPIPLSLYFDMVYYHFINNMKLKSPKKSKVSQDYNYPDLVTVYVFDEPTWGGQASGWYSIRGNVIVCNFRNFFSHPQLRRVSLPHELFHFIEFAYIIDAGMLSFFPTDYTTKHNLWPIEAAAVAIEDIVAPDVRDWTGKYGSEPYNRSFKCPEEPIHSNFNGKCVNASRSGTFYRGDYSKFVLFKFLMRNDATFNMAKFWQEYANKGFNPEGIIPQAYIAWFQLALLADNIASPDFSQEDRAAFNEFLDYENPSHPDRYTYYLPGGSWKISGPAFRITPYDEVSPSSLSKLDSSAMPLKSGATHRWLIEFPSDRNKGRDYGAQAMKFFAQFNNASNLVFNLIPMEESNVKYYPDSNADTPSPAYLAWEKGHPWDGTSFYLDFTGKNYPPGSECLWDGDKLIEVWSRSKMLPQYMLALVTNFGESDVTYKAGLNLENACRKACNDHYVDKLQHCLITPEEACKLQNPAPPYNYRDENGNPDPGPYNACINRYIEGGKPLPRSGFDYTLCPDICTPGFFSLDPYEDYYWGIKNFGKFVCDNASNADCGKPAIFIPINSWPSVPCDMVENKDH